MAKRKKRRCRYGFKKGTHQCRQRPYHRRKRSGLERTRGARAGRGEVKVACGGERVYASKSASAAIAAAEHAAKRLGKTCIVFKRGKRLATVALPATVAP